MWDEGKSEVRGKEDPPYQEDLNLLVDDAVYSQHPFPKLSWWEGRSPVVLFDLWLRAEPCHLVPPLGSQGHSPRIVLIHLTIPSLSTCRQLRVVRWNKGYTSWWLGRLSQCDFCSRHPLITEVGFHVSMAPNLRASMLCLRCLKMIDLLRFPSKSHAFLLFGNAEIRGSSCAPACFYGDSHLFLSGVMFQMQHSPYSAPPYLARQGVIV